jgi:hypothetical protein
VRRRLDRHHLVGQPDLRGEAGLESRVLQAGLFLWAPPQPADRGIPSARRQRAPQPARPPHAGPRTLCGGSAWHGSCATLRTAGERQNSASVTVWLRTKRSYWVAR